MIAVCGGLLLLTAGCGAACSVTGTVTFDGQPVANGDITFLPADGKGPVAAAHISSGAFTVAEITPGPKIVQITAVKVVPFARSTQEMADRAAAQKAQGNATGIIDPADTIPANAEGNNVAMEVKAGSQKLDFHLKSKR